MASVCKQCNSIVNGIEKISCRGNCGSLFHRTCIPGMQRPVLDILATFEQNLFWLCNDCASNFSNWLQRPAAETPTNDITVLKDTVSTLSDVVSNLSSRFDKYFPHGPSITINRGLFINCQQTSPPQNAAVKIVLKFVPLLPLFEGPEPFDRKSKQLTTNAISLGSTLADSTRVT